MEDDVHVVHQDDEWCVKLEGRADALATHDTQEEAVEIARAAARASKRELLIHSTDGTIARDSHGHDPTDRPD